MPNNIFNSLNKENYFIFPAVYLKTSLRQIICAIIIFALFAIQLFFDFFGESFQSTS